MHPTQPRTGRTRRPEFVLVDRSVLDDPRLSLAAKGLYAVVTTWAEGQSAPADASTAVLLHELVAAGYAYVNDEGKTIIGLDLGDEPESAVPPRASQPKAAKADARLVYAIGRAAAEHVKIGVSRDVTARLRNLQTSHHEGLHVLWQGAGGSALEDYLHERFAPRRIRGEWFDFTGVDAVELIAQAAVAFRQAPQ